VSRWIRFKESTMQQVIVILLLIIGGVVLAFIKVPSLNVYTYSWKLSWDTTYKPIDVLDDMMLLHEPSTLTVLMQTMNDSRKIAEADLEKRPDFYDYDKYYLGDYCIYLVGLYTDYDLDFKSDGDKYTWANNFAHFKRWLEANGKDLVWHAGVQRFYNKNDPPPEE
jgi:hypothetical protein